MMLQQQQQQHRAAAAAKRKEAPWQQPVVSVFEKVPPGSGASKFVEKAGDVKETIVSRLRRAPARPVVRVRLRRQPQTAVIAMALFALDDRTRRSASGATASAAPCRHRTSWK